MSTSAPRVIEQILDLARWAPSGDNTQPWRFELTGDETLIVHGFDTREHCVYDFEGRPSQISIGALLETLQIAATHFQRRVRFTRRVAAPEHTPTFDVQLIPDGSIRPDPLGAEITERSVQRRMMSMQQLDADQKSRMAAQLLPGYQVVWRESFGQRLRLARLLSRSARIRLTMPEAYRVHRDVIEFNARFSTDRIPDQAVGLDPLTTRAMQWMMGSWSRVSFFNTWLGGTILPRIELDWLPAIGCAAHFAIVRSRPPLVTDDFVEAGRAVQRFWLGATREKLCIQPAMTPLIFSWYTRADKRFSASPTLRDQAIMLTRQWDECFGADIARRSVFCGRIGAGPRPTARSLRLPLSVLLKPRQSMS